MPSRFICARCTRQIFGLSESIRGPRNLLSYTRKLSPTATSPSSTHAFHTSPSRPAKPKGRMVWHRDSFTRVPAEIVSVPPLEFWEQHTRAPLVPDLSGAELHRAAEAYKAVAFSGASNWQKQLIRNPSLASDAEIEPPLSYRTLHYAACVITSAPPSQTKKAMPLATHILATLTGLLYEPSVLSLVRLGHRTDDLHKMYFRPALEALERILEKGGSADAWTLKGLLLETGANGQREAARERGGTYDGKGYDEALKTLRKALEIGSRDWDVKGSAPTEAEGAERTSRRIPAEQPAWQWRIRFALAVGAIRLHRNEQHKAIEVLRLAAYNFESGQACFLLAQLLEPGDPERVALLERAAIASHAPACREMGRVELERARDATRTKAERRVSEVLAEEWHAVADGDGPR